MTLSVCLPYICSLKTINFHEISLFGPSLIRECTTLCTSGFVDNVMFAHNRPGKGNTSLGRILEVTHQGAAPGAKCDVCDCPVRATEVF